MIKQKFHLAQLNLAELIDVSMAFGEFLFFVIFCSLIDKLKYFRFKVSLNNQNTSEN